MLRTAASIALALAIAIPASGARSKRPKKRRIAERPLVYTVQPSEAIDRRVQVESARALEILAHPDAANLFASPYLVASVYYHDGFLSEFPDEKPDADPARRIAAHIARDLNPEARKAYVARFVQYWCEYYPRADAPPPALVVPVAYESPAPAPAPSRRRFRRRRPRVRTRATHESALDLFTDEGTPVRSASRGLVVLADTGWDAADPFSTTSQLGGNAVIVFDPDNARFFRYAHLGTVATRAGAFVEPGDCIGTVGHTGLNASRPRHGRHVHFEVNQTDGGHVRALKAAELWAIVRGRQAPQSGAP